MDPRAKEQLHSVAGDLLRWLMRVLSETNLLHLALALSVSCRNFENTFPVGLSGSDACQLFSLPRSSSTTSCYDDLRSLDSVTS